MRIVESLSEHLISHHPLAITIGNYDGVHLGHQAIFARLKDRAAQCQGKSAVISFTNHPIEVLKPGTVMLRICSIRHKIKLMEEQGIDYLVLLPFTEEFSQQSPAEFIDKIRKWHPFRYLVLGEDAVFGKNREGDPSCIQDLSHRLSFEVEYLKMLAINGDFISSRKVRHWITAGNFEMAERYLGRKYSIYCSVIEFHPKDRLSIDCRGLCLPPIGDYKIELKYNGAVSDGIIHIRETGIQNVSLSDGFAPGPFIEVVFTTGQQD